MINNRLALILAGLLVEYESVKVVASATRVSPDMLTNMLFDCESRQLEMVTEVPIQTNLVNRQRGDGDTR